MRRERERTKANTKAKRVAEGLNSPNYATLVMREKDRGVMKKLI